MPDMEDRVRNGLTVSAAHRARHRQNFTLVRIIGKVCAAFDKRCAGNVERPLDRPRCATRQACSRILCIHVKIEKMFDANPWDDEFEFRRAILQIVDRLPEFALGDVMLSISDMVLSRKSRMIAFRRALPPASQMPLARSSRV